MKTDDCVLVLLWFVIVTEVIKMKEMFQIASAGNF